MGRPSKAAERIEEILDALEVCILENGIQAASLEKIAEQAGVKRTLLRHYIGNRDEIICALSRRWRQKYTEQWQALVDWLPSQNRTGHLVDSIFTIGSKDRVEATIIGEAIFSEAKRLDSIKQDQEAIMAEFIEHFFQVLQSDFPDADVDTLDLICHGVYANYLLAESFLPLKLIDPVHKLKLATKLLYQSLQ